MIRKYFFGFLIAILAITSLCVGGGICGSLSNLSITYADSEMSAKSTSSGQFELKYDSDKQYFYFEDGYYPQSYVGWELTETLNTQYNDGTLASTYSLTIAGQTCPVCFYEGSYYARVKNPREVTISLNGTNTLFGNYYFWFLLEPIRWRVSDFGVAESKKEEFFKDIRFEDIQKLAVSDIVLDWCVMSDDMVQEGWKYSDSSLFSIFNSNVASVGALSFAVESEKSFDYFSKDGSNKAVKTTSESVKGVYQVSFAELDENFENKCAYASDLVCMLAGISDTQFCDYWTRDLFNLNNGKYITNSGILRSRYFSSSCGVRLGYKVLVPLNAYKLKEGHQVNEILKNATYSTQNTTTTKIIFDYYTAVDEYAPNGTNLIANKTGRAVDVDDAGTIKVYGAGTSTIYVLSNKIISMNEDGNAMFYELREIETIDFNNFDTSYATTMMSMFHSCGRTASTLNLDLDCFDTSNVVNMDGMFLYCGWGASNSFTLDISSFNTSNVATMWGMFEYCAYHTNSFRLDLSHFDTSNVTDMSLMFASFAYVTEELYLDISSFNTSKVTKMAQMFYEAMYNLDVASLDLSHFDVSNVTDFTSMMENYGLGSNEVYLNLSNWEINENATISDIFRSCGTNATSFELYLSNWNTSKMKNMNGMFALCGRGAAELNLDLSSFDTSNVTSMSSMFYGCGASATSFNLNLSSFDTSNVTSMYGMFSGFCPLATNGILDLSSFDTSNVTVIQDMFAGCASLTTIYVSEKWSTESLDEETRWFTVFTGCTSLVGGYGTVFDEGCLYYDYARIDTPETPGYFTHINGKSGTLLKTGMELNCLIKNVSDYLTSSKSVGKIVFDYYRNSAGKRTTSKTYYVNGTNVISGKTGIDVSYQNDGSAMLYNAGGQTVYILSAIDMIMNKDSSYMFYRIYGYPVSTWVNNLEFVFNNVNTYKVTNMSYMFSLCEVQELDLS
ncbi:MAG: BspA family leucine-rich repeat surface protein [Clostridia bacterium]|nr:BspA family leucine-rich repeat surface protein [Clostridia bacterium]